jgi:hypothetical protein
MSLTDIVPTDLLTRKQAAGYLRDMNCSVRTARTLSQMASDGNGPPIIRDGNRAMYSRAELEQWRRSRLRRGESK